MSKQRSQIPATGTSIIEERLKRLELQVSNSSSFVNSYLLGTLRTDITTAPASSIAITPGVDKLYDQIQLYPYLYIATYAPTIANPSIIALQWVRISMSTF